MKSLKTFCSEEQSIGKGNLSPLSLALSSLQAPSLLMAIETSIIRLPKYTCGEETSQRGYKFILPFFLTQSLPFSHHFLP